MLLLCVCDDSLSDRLNTENLIREYCFKEGYDNKIISFENGEALVNYYASGKTPFDIIFLDIYMSGKNGIMTAKQIRKIDMDVKIIFTTSSAEHALESFEVIPFHYLVKPISNKLFDTAFERAIRTIQKEKKRSLSFKTVSSVYTVLCKDILFIESNAKVLNIHTAKKEKFEYVAKLDDIEKQMNDKRFIRCHKSFLVNMDYVLRVESYSFILLDEICIQIAQRHFAGIKKTFYDYILEKANLKNETNVVELL